MKKPYKHFDLPTYHLSGEHYVPARARHSSEIERRRMQPAGTLLLEQQRDGLAVASAVVNQLEEDDDLRFAGDMLAASGLNASWYSFAEGADVMRRRLYLPELADDETGWRETREGLLEKVRSNLAHVADVAWVLTDAKREGLRTDRTKTQLGRALGTVSLGLASLHLGDAPETVSAFRIQDSARRASLTALDRSRTVASEIGMNASIAQLADPDSPLSVHWRRNAPNGAHQAFIKAQEEGTQL